MLCAVVGRSRSQGILIVLSLKPVSAGGVRVLRGVRGFVFLLSVLLSLPVSAQVQRTFVNLGFELPSAAPSRCYF